jgi:hypothetical protein
MPHRATRPTRWTGDHWRFLAATLAPAAVLTLGRIPALPTSAYLAKHLTLSTVPLSLQHTLTHILLVPLGALLVVLARLTLGIHILGPFRSILLTFAFVATGLVLGTTLVGVALTGVAAIPGLEQLLLRRPELLLVEIVPIVVVSTLGTWRLLEAINPRSKTAHPLPAPRAVEATSRLMEARSS